MTYLKPFFRANKFMLHMDDAACGDENENDFTEVSAGNDVIHPDRLLVS